MFEREKKVDCGPYREIDIIPRTDNAERAVKGKRGKRRKVTEPKQRDLNHKNSRRYVVQLGNGNFGIGDIHISATYDKKHLPRTLEEAENIVTNFLRRIAYRRRKMGLPPLKYILITEYAMDEEGNFTTRIHHHIILNGGIDRDDLELMWTSQRINWNKMDNPEYRQSIKQMGWINADRLQVNENGIEALAKYITKNPNGKKSWSSSRNLIRPVEQPPADHKYSVRQIENIAKLPDGGKEFFEKKYPNYNIVSIKPEYYDQTGWHIYLKMWKKPDNKNKDKQTKKKSAKKEGMNNERKRHKGKNEVIRC